MVNFCVIGAKNFVKIKQDLWCNLVENPSVISFREPVYESVNPSSDTTVIPTCEEGKTTSTAEEQKEDTDMALRPR